MYKECLGNDLIYELVDKLNPRDSVKGGRTEVFRMYCCVDDPKSEVIRYLDVNSLYPYVMGEIEFPIGHPKIRCGDYSCRNVLNKLKLKKEQTTWWFVHAMFGSQDGWKVIILLV